MKEILILSLICCMFKSICQENNYSVFLPHIEGNAKQLYPSYYDSIYNMSSSEFICDRDTIDYIFNQGSILDAFTITKLNKDSLTFNRKRTIDSCSIKKHIDVIEYVYGYNVLLFLPIVKKAYLVEEEVNCDLGDSFSTIDYQKECLSKQFVKRFNKNGLNYSNINFDSSIDGFVFHKTILFFGKKNEVVAILYLSSLKDGVYEIKYNDLYNIRRSYSGEFFGSLITASDF